MNYELVILEQPGPEDREAILAPLVRYNQQKAPAVRAEPLVISVRGADGQAMGGLWGRTGYDWLFIELLVVPEALRGQKVGTTIMRQAEAIARERGCIGAWLDTFEFQARGFYEKLGYRVFGEIGDYPRGSARYFLQKRFD
ncbi:MAG TPA: GNAT family N-acetyltransferase [Aliidongia sp.]|nr:GNAT family N-acetyltransferase [Aliidongia sp.]